MNNWVLLVFLHLWGTGPSNPGTVTMMNVTGFRTEEMCLEAAKKTNEELFLPNIRRDQTARIICVRQK